METKELFQIVYKCVKDSERLEFPRIDKMKIGIFDTKKGHSVSVVYNKDTETAELSWGHRGGMSITKEMLEYLAGADFDRLR